MTEHVSHTMTAKTRLILLALGAGTGLLLAASQLVVRWTESSGVLPSNMIARVGNHYIPQTRYLELVSDLEADKRTPLTAEDRQFILGRLIDEELLIQRGVELDLPGSSPVIRKAIAAAVIAQVAAESEAEAPDEHSLRALYESDAEFFSTTGRYQLRWWYLQGSDEDSARNAQAALELLRFDVSEQEVEQRTGLMRERMLPEQLLPLNKLADYLGSGLVQMVAEIEPGTYSEPLAADGRTNIIFLVDYQQGVLPPFEELRPVIEAEYYRRAGDRALRDYLSWLRERADIVVDSGQAR